MATFTDYNKVLPGVYVRFQGKTQASGMVGTRGIMTMPTEVDWGAENILIHVTPTQFASDALRLFGYSADSAELLCIREALKAASELVLYRTNGGGTKATAQVGGVTATALYGGTRGNSIKISVEQNGALFDVVTVLDGAQLDRQTVSDGSQLKANGFVTFEPHSELTVSPAVSLAGGTNIAVTEAVYDAYFALMATESFNTITYCGNDTAIKNKFADFVRSMREEQGRMVQCVLYDFDGDYEGVINLKNGVILSDGTVVNGDKAVAFVAAASAAASVSTSLTNAVYPDAVSADVKYSPSQLEQLTAQGAMVFYTDGQSARILSDINSLVTLTDNKSVDFKSNRVIRVADGIVNDVTKLFTQSFMGNMTNSKSGRSLFKSSLISYFDKLYSMGAIERVDAQSINVLQGATKRDVVAEISVIPVDSMEKLYMSITIE
ncbi:MAG: phage tail sheath protein [Ruminococcaceae bacterium]|nr:phage tail sheath protein [Oscillospiraceae bacterium]